MNEAWGILGIDPCDDLEFIKATYSNLLKQYKPQERPEEFIKIRQAYEEIVAFIKNSNKQLDQYSNSNNSNNDINIDKESSVNDLNEIYYKIMDVYNNKQSRNDVGAWKEILNKYFFEIKGVEKFGVAVLDDIIQKQYLYKTELVLDADIYILLFDFFSINERFFIYNVFNMFLSDTLVSKIRHRRFALRTRSINPSAFNQYDPYKQTKAEFFIEEEIFSNSLEELINHGVLKSKIRYAKDNDFLWMLRRAVFRTILDEYLTNNVKMDPILIGYIYESFKINRYKRYTIKNLVGLGYHHQEINNCLEFCKQQYTSFVLPYKLWWRFINEHRKFMKDIFLVICSFRIRFRSPIVKKDNSSS